MRVTDKFVFFWGSKDIYSQWHYSLFYVGDVLYNCAEQYMMAEKARLFGDFRAADEIMRATHPGEMKRIGRRVKGFSKRIWLGHRQLIVFDGNRAKFSSNNGFKEALLSTEPRILVEASSDQIWGNGLKSDSPFAENVRKWAGLNLLGFTLAHLRNYFTI
ncbi:MAG: NADAR family protein [bacterium]|nr:NADAR family protein [bacterium]